MYLTIGYSDDLRAWLDQAKASYDVRWATPVYLLDSYTKQFSTRENWRRKIARELTWFPPRIRQIFPLEMPKDPRDEVTVRVSIEI